MSTVPEFTVDPVASDRADWPSAYSTDDGSGADWTVWSRLCLDGELASAYPVSTHDRQIVFSDGIAPGALAAVTSRILQEEPRCRRVVLDVPAEDLDAIAFAEDAGFRYVVEVDIGTDAAVAERSLLVTEPDWVRARDSTLDDVPLETTHTNDHH